MSSCTSEVPDADKELLRDGFADELVAVGVDQVRVAEFVQLLRDCSVTTRGALRLFAASLPALVDHMYHDERAPLGPLKAKGFLATVRVSALLHARARVDLIVVLSVCERPQEVGCIPSEQAGVLFGLSKGKRQCSSSSSSSSAASRLLRDVAPVDPATMNLPAHVVQEAQALAAAGGIDNPITEMNARPLVKSVAIWLVLQGVLNKEDNPGVIARAG